MKTRLTNPVSYLLTIDNYTLELNSLLGKTMNLVFTGEIYCIHCGRKTTKSFQQGHCFPCYRELLASQLCIIHPERCIFHGKCPKEHWVSEEHSKPHIIYLANSSGLKIGITRESNVPTRWIDQGAVQALSIMKVSNRYQAGLLEVEFKKHINDKTNWRSMLKGKVDKIDLIKERNKIFKMINDKIIAIKKNMFEGIMLLFQETPLSIHYPVLNYPIKIVSFNFDKQHAVSGKLLGIKGQYLIFDTGVINIRKFGGYKINISTLINY